jgi:hypothetical protein
MTHRDGFSEFSARNLWRGDAGHRKAQATLSESSEKPPARSSKGRVGGRQQALTMLWHRLRRASYPTRPLDDPYGSLSALLGMT